MRILELIGNALRPFHSDDSKLTESTTALTDRKITMMSPVFANKSPIPKAFTDEGEKLFPLPAIWSESTSANSQPAY